MIRFWGRHALFSALGFASFGMTVPAHAQVAPPASINPPTREEIDRGTTAPPPAPPRLIIEGDIERAACPLADPAYAEVRVTITDAVFNNLKGVTPEELRSTYAPYLGRPQPVSIICEIRDAAATILRRKGYLAAVQVPTQRIENGIVRFEVLFARVTAIRVRGNAGRAEKLIGGYLGRLAEEPIFNRYTAERYLLLARDLPGHDIRLALRPAGTGPGELIGEVTVIRTPFEADLNVQNFAGRDTGRFGGQVRVQYYGLTGMGDRTSAALYSTADFAEQQVLQLAHEFRLGKEGLTLGGRFTYAWTKPDIGPAAVDLKARTLFASIEAGYPFIRTRAVNVRGAAGVDFINQRVDFVGPLSRDRLRVGYLRVEGDAVDMSRQRLPQWRVGGALELRHGLAILDASKRCGLACPVGTGPSRTDGDPSGTVIRFAGSLEYAPSSWVSIAILPRLQYGFDPLFSFEEYSGGTYTIGRGYDPGTIIGDSGAGYQTEIRAGRLTPFTNADIMFQPYAFIDTAWAWNRNVGGDPQHLASIGAGVRGTLASRARLDVTLAVPTRAAGLQTRKGDARLLISLSTRLWPWGDR